MAERLILHLILPMKGCPLSRELEGGSVLQCWGVHYLEKSKEALLAVPKELLAVPKQYLNDTYRELEELNHKAGVLEEQKQETKDELDRVKSQVRPFPSFLCWFILIFY